LPNSWKRSEQEDHGWKLDISKELIDNAVGEGKGKKKKVFLFGNSGGRGRS
jgi:hypothetical protein